MRTKPFRAADKATALRMIRDELGPDALILQERRVKPGLFGLLGPEQVEIIAGVDDVAQSAPVAPPPPSNGVHADFSAAARRLARDVQDADPRDLLPPKPAGGLSDEGASKLAAILESFSKSGQPVPPAMAASLADLIGRSPSGDEVTLASLAPAPAPKPAE